MNIKINLIINFNGRRRNFNVAMYILSKMKFERYNDAKKLVCVVSFTCLHTTELLDDY